MKPQKEQTLEEKRGYEITENNRILMHLAWRKSMPCFRSLCNTDIKYSTNISTAEIVLKRFDYFDNHYEICDNCLTIAERDETTDAIVIEEELESTPVIEENEVEVKNEVKVEAEPIPDLKLEIKHD